MPTPQRRLLGAMLLACAAAATGCRDGIDSLYGRRAGPGAAASVNGTAVLAGMFEKAGHNVHSWWTLSPRLRQRADCIVWFPDDFQPPGDDVRAWLEDWLRAKSGRTLIYVGRDFDAAGWYWDHVVPVMPAGSLNEARRRGLEAKQFFQSQRAGIPASDDCDWFTLDGTSNPRQVRTLQGDPEWLSGVDPSKLEIELVGRVAPPQPAAPQGNADNPDDDASGGVRHEVLLESEGDLLVSRQTWTIPPWYEQPWDELPPSAWASQFENDDPGGESRLLVVANGSFLLNLPLVNHEHRKLAGKLIREIGDPPRTVVFLESFAGGPSILDEDPFARPPSGMNQLVEQRWIFLHFALLGVLLCFARWPVFGIPRELPAEDRADFGRHVQALGELLSRSGDRTYAMTRLLHYRQTVQGGETKTRAKRSGR